VPLPGHHAWAHRPRWLGGADPLVPFAPYTVKCFADRGALDGNLPDSAVIVSTGDGKGHFQIEHDHDQSEMVHVAAFVSVAGAVTVQIRNVTGAYDFLTTPLTIDTGEKSSYFAATPAVIDATKIVDMGDDIRIDVDAADGTAEGLCVTVQFAVR
jgi:hypothetical protein